MRGLFVVAVLAVGCGGSARPAPPDLAVAADLSAAVMPLPAECDVYRDSGCPAGEKCTIGTDHGQPRDLCFAVAPNPLGEGAACSAVTAGDRAGDDCAPGLVCLDFPGDGPHCRKPCFLRGDCPSGGGCVLSTPTSTIGTVDGGSFVLRACIADAACNPIAQSGCAGGRACYLSPPDDVSRVTFCLTTQMPGMPGDDCDRQAACAPGMRCNGFGFCRRLCYYDVPDGGAPAGAGTCPAVEGPCDRLALGGIYGVCGAE